MSRRKIVKLRVLNMKCLPFCLRCLFKWNSAREMCQFVTALLKLTCKMTEKKTHTVPRDKSSAHRSQRELPQLGKAPRPAEQPEFRWEVSKSNNFLGRFVHRGSSEICSPGVDIAQGSAGHESLARTDTTFYLDTSL